MFKALGLRRAAYTAPAVLRGKVRAGSGARVRAIRHAAMPRPFWTTIAPYTGLAAALRTIRRRGGARAAPQPCATTWSRASP